MRTQDPLTFSEALASLEPEALKVIAASVPSWAAIVRTVFCWWKGKMDTDTREDGFHLLLLPLCSRAALPHLLGSLSFSLHQTTYTQAYTIPWCA